MPRRFTVLGFALNLVFTAGTVQAAPILSPVAATASSTFPGFPIANTINHSGLLTDFTSGVTDFDAYLATNPLHSRDVPNEWFSAEPSTSAVVTYDLGTLFSVDRLSLWNENGVGIDSFNVLFSADGIAFSPAVSGLSPTDSPFDSDYPAQVFNLGIGSARFVRLDITSCPQPGSPRTFCGIGEVAFAVGAPTAVPEPATLILLGTGLAAVARRRFTKRHVA